MLNLIRRVSSLAVVAIIFSVICHVSAVLMWLVVYPDYQPYIGFDIAFLILTTLSAGFAGMMLVVRDILVFRIVLYVRFFFFLILNISLQGHLLFLLPFFMALTFETAVYEDFPINLVTNIGFLLTSTAIKVAYLTTFYSPELLRDFMLYFLAGGIIAVVGSFLLRYFQRMIDYGQEVIKLDRAFTDLSKASEGYLRIAHTAEERSVKSERERITRELHDTVGYTFTNLIMLTEAAKAVVRVDLECLARKLDDAWELARQGMEETRCSLYLLREQEVNKLRGLAALNKLIRTFESATSVRTIGKLILDRKHETAVRRGTLPNSSRQSWFAACRRRT